MEVVQSVSSREELVGLERRFWFSGALFSRKNMFRFSKKMNVW